MLALCFIKLVTVARITLPFIGLGASNISGKDKNYNYKNPPHTLDKATVQVSTFQIANSQAENLFLFFHRYSNINIPVYYLYVCGDLKIECSFV